MIISNIKKKVREYSYYKSCFLPRYNDGARDLQKALNNVNDPISEEQKEMIMDFWEPIICKGGKLSRKAFDIRWFDVYNTTNVDNHKLQYYIPDSYYYCIVDANLSNSKEASIIDDKNLYDLYFYDVKQPQTIGRITNGRFLNNAYELITEERLLSLCKEYGRIIIKPSVNSCAGSGIVYWDSSQSSIDELKNIFKSYRFAIIQDLVEQHKVLADFNDSSVNTLRIVTLILDGEVHTVSSVVIMGAKGSKTNHLHRGGLVCGVLDSGYLRSTAFDGQLNRYDVHPNGIKFSDVKIPNYDKCLELVKKMAPRFYKTTKLISWDITIDKVAEPVLIETNLTWGGLCQIANGPIFGNLTPKVLDYVIDNLINK